MIVQALSIGVNFKIRNSRDPEAFDSNESEYRHPNIRNDLQQTPFDPNHAEEDEDPTPDNTQYPVRERRPRTVGGAIPWGIVDS